MFVHDRDKFCIAVYALFSSSHLLPRVCHVNAFHNAWETLPRRHRWSNHHETVPEHYCTWRAFPVNTGSFPLSQSLIGRWVPCVQ